jgi:C1A family cysteine protease
MFAKTVVVALLLALATANLVEEQFVSFVNTYNKKYDTTEQFFHRFNIFKAKVKEIEAHNAGNHTYTLGINEFSDLTWEEFSATYLGFAGGKSDAPSWEAPVSNKIPNDDVDWRKKGAVTPVKNQGSCGSCWDFAGTGTIETFTFLKQGTLINLSEQHTLDCSKGGSCAGGLMDKAIDWGCQNGICGTAEYPYTARQGSCKSTCAIKSTKCSGAKKLNSEKDQEAALDVNTVSIGVYIGAQFQSYKSGIFNGPCGSGGHAMILVGYEGQSAWIVKNSWGASWGEQGYSRWARGKDLCKFSSYSHIPN